MPDITEAMVEAAARAIWANIGEWDDADDATKHGLRNEARAALEAALPLMVEAMKAER